MTGIRSLSRSARLGQELFLAREPEPTALVLKEPSCYHFRVLDPRVSAMHSATLAAVTIGHCYHICVARRRCCNFDGALGGSLPISREVLRRVVRRPGRLRKVHFLGLPADSWQRMLGTVEIARGERDPGGVLRCKGTSATRPKGRSPISA
jgi:hypothetical protein